MKILLLAYACEPNRGSEPGIGWKWAVNLASNKENEIHVLTRSNNKPLIEEYWKGNCPSNLHFHYYDLPSLLIWAKHHGFPVNLYYALWLRGCSSFAEKLNACYHFDVAHHITFGVYRDACYLYRLNVPYVLGPLGGGEATPKKLLSLYSGKEKLKEYLRSFANTLAWLNPWLHKSFNNASLILTKTQDTKDVLNKWADKTYVNLEIGINEIAEAVNENVDDVFLFVGRFTYWKGVKLALLAFRKYAKQHPSAQILFIGKGEMERDILSFAESNALKDNIKIIPWIQQDELKRYYASAKAMLFPSLHDSSGNVVLESLSFGLPVVCLDCGGPASILGDTLKGLIVSTDNADVNMVVEGLYKVMERLSVPDFRKRIGQACIVRASEMLWTDKVSKTYQFIGQKLKT